MCSQHLSEFSSIQFETSHVITGILKMCMLLLAQKNIISDKVTAILIDISDISFQYRFNVLGMGQGVVTGVGHMDITSVLQTQVSGLMKLHSNDEY